MSGHSNEVLLALAAADAADAGTFDSALDSLLRQARDEANPSAGLRALIDERLRSELAAPAGTSGAQQPEPERLRAMLGSGVRPLAAGPRRWARFARGAGLVTVGVAIGFVWGRSSSQGPHEPRGTESNAAQSGSLDITAARPPSPHPTPEEREAISSTAQVQEPPPQDTQSEAAARAPVAGRRPDAGRAGEKKALRARDRRAQSAGADSLRFVLQQLRKAQLFLRAGEAARALSALDLIDARVPAEVLQDEREVTRTLALCDSGEMRAAASLAERVLERSPDSAYAVSLRESCAGKQELLEEIRERTSNPEP
jgi:hypothetical protein